MRTKHLVATFNELNEKHPDWGIIPLLRMACSLTNPSKWMIRNAFNKFVPKDDYGSGDKHMVLEDLYRVGLENQSLKINKIE